MPQSGWSMWSRGASADSLLRRQINALLKTLTNQLNLQVYLASLANDIHH